MIAPSLDPRELDDEDVDEELRLLQSIHNNRPVINAFGVIDETTVLSLIKYVNKLKLLSGSSLIINMAGVTYVDSEGFGFLMSLQNRLTESGGRLILVSCCDDVRLAMKLTRLEVLFPMYDSLQEIP